MPSKKLESVAKTLREKAVAKRAEKRARARRIRHNEPDGAVEKVQASARQAAEVADAAREFASETALDSFLNAPPGAEETGPQTEMQTAAQRPASAPQPGSGGDTIVASKDDTVVTPTAATFASELGRKFDDTGFRDTDGVVEASDLRISEDINGDGEIGVGETFQPQNPPDEINEVPRGDSDGFDDLLI